MQHGSILSPDQAMSHPPFRMRVYRNDMEYGEWETTKSINGLEAGKLTWLSDIHDIAKTCYSTTGSPTTCSVHMNHCLRL